MQEELAGGSDLDWRIRKEKSTVAPSDVGGQARTAAEGRQVNGATAAETLLTGALVG